MALLSIGITSHPQAFLEQYKLEDRPGLQTFCGLISMAYKELQTNSDACKRVTSELLT